MCLYFISLLVASFFFFALLGFDGVRSLSPSLPEAILTQDIDLKSAGLFWFVVR